MRSVPRRLLLATLAVWVCVMAVAGCARGGGVAAGGGRAGKILIRYQVPDDAPAGQRFHVHRASSEAGPFERLTAEPVALPTREPGKVITLFTDRDVVLGATYYYYLESVDRSGRTSKATEVAPAKALLPLQPEDAGAPSPSIPHRPARADGTRP